MLSHIERKVLRMMINCSHYGQIQLPSLNDFTKKLCQWTGRNEQSIYKILHSLHKKGYLVIEDDHIVKVYENPIYRDCN
jgi:hypothetical protein